MSMISLDQHESCVNPWKNYVIRVWNNLLSYGGSSWLLTWLDQETPWMSVRPFPERVNRGRHDLSWMWVLTSNRQEPRKSGKEKGTSPFMQAFYLSAFWPLCKMCSVTQSHTHHHEGLNPLKPWAPNNAFSSKLSVQGFFLQHHKIGWHIEAHEAPKKVVSLQGHKESWWVNGWLCNLKLRLLSSEGKVVFWVPVILCCLASFPIYSLPQTEDPAQHIPYMIRHSLWPWEYLSPHRCLIN